MIQTMECGGCGNNFEVDVPDKLRHTIDLFTFYCAKCGANLAQGETT